MHKTLNDYAGIYQAQLEMGDIQVAYEGLLKYMMKLKAFLEAELTGRYNFGYVSPGYMDYSYFSFFDETLRANKLRFGIVLNHKQLRFELWLMGQNAKVQEQYWQLLKDTKWNEHRAQMPKYSALEAVLVESPDFDDLPALSETILKSTMSLTDKISSLLT